MDPVDHLGLVVDDNGYPLLFCQAKIADDIGWAHCFWEGMLLMASSWPSDTDEPGYRWHGVGLVHITTETANNLEWALCCYTVIMKVAWGGPIASHKIHS